MNEKKIENPQEIIDDIQLNYNKYNRLLADIDLDVFFAHNRIPSIANIPSLPSIKSGFIAMNERLYKRAKKLEETRRQDPNYIPRTKMRRKYLDAFDEKKMGSVRLQREVRKNIKMYVHTQALIHLFRSFYTLLDHHHRICDTYPVISNAYMKTVCMVFASMEKTAAIEMLSEIATNAKMFAFFKDLYHVWENETVVQEKEHIIGKTK